MIDVRLARELRRRGYDVESCQEAGRANQRISDEAQLAYAAQQGRAILTFNFLDFVPIDAAWKAARRQHAGIVVSIEIATSASCSDVSSGTWIITILHSSTIQSCGLVRCRGREWTIYYIRNWNIGAARPACGPARRPRASERHGVAMERLHGPRAWLRAALDAQARGPAALSPRQTHRVE